MNWWTNLRRRIGGCLEPTQPPQPPDHSPCRVPLYWSYFGTQDDQVQATHNDVNLVHVGSWGDWVTPAGRAALTDTIVMFMHEAAMDNLKIMITLDWCLFTQTNPRQMLPLETSRTYLDAFFSRIRNEGLRDSVVAFYLIDEPNIPEIDLSTQAIGDSIAWANAVAGFYWPILPQMAAIYGWVNNGNHWPGLNHFDWVGFDNYGAAIFDNGMYQSFVNRLTPAQKTILVPGGSDPWREDPTPFYDYAQIDTRVIMIMPFKWFGSDGIGANGMAPVYQGFGERVVETNP